MREHLNVFIDASLIYLDDYMQRDGTRLEVKWFRGHMEHRKPLSTIEFDDQVMVLSRWRDAIFGTTPTMNGIMMDHPIILEAVNEHATQHALRIPSKHAPWTTTDTLPSRSYWDIAPARKPRKKAKRP